MRVDFTKTAHQILRDDKQTVFMTGDLGYNSFENLQTELGPRFFNMGVAEQNMIGVAAGLALQGFQPWVYSISPFVTYRVLEQIRNDVCLHRLPVRIVGNGGGFTYGVMGSTHHTLEDMSALKALPNLTLILPTTNGHVPSCVHALHALPGPGFLRLGISGFASDAGALSENPRTLTRQYRKGSQVTVVGVGQATQLALNAFAESEGVAIFGVARFPFDLAADTELRASLTETGKVLVIEEHYRPGSLAESFCLEIDPKIHREVVTATYRPGSPYGGSKFQLQQAGLGPDQLTASLSRLREIPR